MLKQYFKVPISRSGNLSISVTEVILNIFEIYFISQKFDLHRLFGPLSSLRYKRLGRKCLQGRFIYKETSWETQMLFPLMCIMSEYLLGMGNLRSLLFKCKQSKDHSYFASLVRKPNVNKTSGQSRQHPFHRKYCLNFAYILQFTTMILIHMTLIVLL